MSNDQTQQPGRLFVISAPSGAGKTSLTHAVIRQMEKMGRSLRFSVSCTTRAPRAGERDGVDYHFVDKKTFDHMVEQGEFLEYASVFGRGYGTGRHQVRQLQRAGHDVILDIDWQGAQQVRASAPDCVSIFIMPPTRDALERRLHARGLDDDQTIQQRLAKADEEMSHAQEFDYIVVNDAFETALEELGQIIRLSGAS